MSIISDSGGIFLANDITSGVRFQCWPETISDAKAVNWASMDIVGRSEPILSYHSSTNRKLGLTLIFVASIDEKDEVGTQKVQERVNFIKSLQYPVRSKGTGFSSTPPVALLIVGDLIYTKCVVESVDVEWSGVWEFDYVTQLRRDFSNSAGVPGLALRGNGLLTITEDTRPIASLPIMAKVSISLLCINDTPLTHEYVRSKGDRINSDSRIDLLDEVNRQDTEDFMNGF